MMLREFFKRGIGSGECVCAISQFPQLAYRLRFLTTLSSPSVVMGVTISSKKKNVVERVPKPSGASFMTTGTIETSGFVQDRGKKLPVNRVSCTS